MKLLIVAATEAEIRPFLDHLVKRPALVDICITGVGMVASTFALAKRLHGHKYNLVLQVGICGAFDRQLQLGELVSVHSEQYGDLGAQDHDNYLDVFEMGLMDKNNVPFVHGRLETQPLSVPAINQLKQVNGLTVNTVSGNEHTIKTRTEKYACQVESMEGAAFHYVCLQDKIPFAQVRSISNYVEPRDKSKWKIKEAVENLNQWLISFIEQEKIFK